MTTDTFTGYRGQGPSKAAQKIKAEMRAKVEAKAARASGAGAAAPLDVSADFELQQERMRNLQSAPDAAEIAKLYERVDQLRTKRAAKSTGSTR